MRQETASRTARKVALSIVTLGAKPGMDKVLPPGLVESTAQLLVASGAVTAPVVRWARARSMVSVQQAFDWMMPGQFEALGHRKAFCERQVREGIGGGATQVLVLGAGYDTLGWRLSSEFNSVGFFEIDHPATARLKARGIRQMGCRDNLHLVSEDLGERELADVLAANPFWNREAKTVILAEGLLMYLPPDAPRRLLAQCAASTGAGSRMAFTYVAAGADGRPDVGRWTRLVLWILEASGEPWQWSMRPQDLGAFLDGTGWTSAPSMVGSTHRLGVEFLAVVTRSK